jgi:hypothetical protein
LETGCIPACTAVASFYKSFKLCEFSLGAFRLFPVEAFAPGAAVANDGKGFNFDLPSRLVKILDRDQRARRIIFVREECFSDLDKFSPVVVILEEDRHFCNIRDAPACFVERLFKNVEGMPHLGFEVVRYVLSVLIFCTSFA